MHKRSITTLTRSALGVAGLALCPLAVAVAAQPTVAELEAKVEALEAALSQLKGQISDVQETRPAHEAKMRTLDNRVTAVETAADAPVKALEERVAAVERADAAPRRTGNELFFRGGFAALVEDRAFGSFTDTHGLLGGGAANDVNEGFHVGAGFDFLLTPDSWGLMKNTALFAELGLEFKNLGSSNTSTVVPLAQCLLVGGPVGTCANAAQGDVAVTMLTVSASPKIEFFQGSRLRPWIIPVGLDINVISPPSDAATVLDLGAQFGLGAEYDVLPGIRLGVDARYHYAANFTAVNNDLSLQQVNQMRALGMRFDGDQRNDFYTVGAYLGIGF